MRVVDLCGHGKPSDNHARTPVLCGSHAVQGCRESQLAPGIQVQWDAFSGSQLTLQTTQFTEAQANTQWYSITGFGVRSFIGQINNDRQKTPKTSSHIVRFYCTASVFVRMVVQTSGHNFIVGADVQLNNVPVGADGMTRRRGYSGSLTNQVYKTFQGGVKPPVLARFKQSQV